VSEPDFCAAPTRAERRALAMAQLATLAERERDVRAFVALDPEKAARDLAADHAGPLAGALVGLKDIIATADFPTRYGSRDPAVAGPRSDAWCVSRLKALGAILLGKTVCTEFAFPEPGPTRNPHDLSRTPGGSSMGSAAAVAAGFVSFAVGTQTAGSTIRPASFCGITGFKPSYGLLHLEGVQAISTTCDHLGLFASSPRDAWYLASALAMAAPEVLPAAPPRRLLLLRLPAELPQGDDYPARIERLARALESEGIAVERRDLPFPLADFRGLQQALCYWEAARIVLSSTTIRPIPELRALLEPYLARDLDFYAAARRRRQAHQAEFDRLMADFDAALLPAATGVAPPAPATGDAVMSRFWTALHVPAISVPIWRGEAGLPLGLQLVGRLGDDARLIRVAQWIYERETA